MTQTLQHAIKSLLYATLILTPLARASVQDWAVTLIVLTAVAMITLFLLECTLAWRWRLPGTPADKPLAALTLLILIATVFSRHRATSIDALVQYGACLVFFYAAVHILNSRADLKRLVGLIIGMAVFLSLTAWLKAAGNLPVSYWQYTDLPEHAFRWTGTFGNPDHLAGYLEMATPLAMGLLFTGMSAPRKWLLRLMVLFLMTALVFTLSRGGWIGMCAGLMVMGGVTLYHNRFARKHTPAAVGLIAAAMLLIILYQTPVIERLLTLGRPEKALGGRLDAWAGLIDMLSDYLIIGSGPGTFSLIYTQYQPAGLNIRFNAGHSDYLHFGAELGLAAFPIMVWLAAVVWRTAMQRLKSPSRLVRGVVIGALTGLAALAVHSFGDFNLHIPANALLFSILGAILMAPPAPFHEIPSFPFLRKGGRGDFASPPIH